MSTYIAYCPHCHTVSNVICRELRRKRPLKKRLLRTRFYHCERCNGFIFSEYLDKKKQPSPPKEMHYGFCANRA